MQDFFTRDQEKLSEFNSVLNSAKNIVLISHLNPDGDAFGSALGMYCFLKNFSVETVTYISPTDYADFLSWMPHSDKILVYDQKNKEVADNLITTADMIFCLDFSSVSRMKEMQSVVINAKGKKIIIDHHEQPESFADFLFWDQQASSTCELVIRFIEDLGQSDLIDQETATCLYTGLLTDTGSFKYSSTTPQVHKIASFLLEKGVNPTEVNRKLFDNNTIDRLQFLGYVLNKKMVYLPEFRVCYIALTEKELKKYNSKSGDTEGIVNYGLSIAGVVVSAIFIEKEGIIKISFRSIHDFSVADIARDHFEGGGHKNAAGGKSKTSLEQTVDKFVNLLPFYKNKILLQPN
jgi:phosphoesterase RecJ-like protein